MVDLVQRENEANAAEANAAEALEAGLEPHDDADRPLMDKPLNVTARGTEHDLPLMRGIAKCVGQGCLPAAPA